MKIEINNDIAIIDGVEFIKKEIEKKSEIDWSKMPVDTLVEVSNDKMKWHVRYFKEKVDDKISCFYSGRTSHTSIVKGLKQEWKYIRLIDNPWRPWFGGEMPCCGNVKTGIMRRCDKDFNNYFVMPAEDVRWSWTGSDGDIIAYMMKAE